MEQYAIAINSICSKTILDRLFEKTCFLVVCLFYALVGGAYGSQ
jgi:hypothetical protein